MVWCNGWFPEIFLREESDEAKVGGDDRFFDFHCFLIFFLKFDFFILVSDFRASHCVRDRI